MLEQCWILTCNERGCTSLPAYAPDVQNIERWARNEGWQREIRNCGEDPDEVLHWCPAHLQPGGSWETD